MGFYDREKIISVLDINIVLNIVQDVGIKVKKIGSKYSILCMNHNDTKYGSCFLDRSGCYCFACGTSMNVFDIIMKSNSFITINEAFAIAADHCGGRYLFETHKNRKDKKRLFPVSKKCLDFLEIKNFNTSRYNKIISASSYIDSNKTFNNKKMFIDKNITINNYETKTEYLIKEAIITDFSLQFLYETEPDIVYQLLADKAKEKMNKCKNNIINIKNNEYFYKVIIYNCFKKDTSKKNIEKEINEVYKITLQKILDQYLLAKKIHEIFSKEKILDTKFISEIDLAIKNNNVRIASF